MSDMNLASTNVELRKLQRLGRGTTAPRFSHYPRWDKKMKHIRSEQRKVGK